MEALKSYTINNAYAAFEENIKGSLTPVNYVDIIVLCQDILAVPEAQFPDTQVDYTIVGGQLKFDRQTFQANNMDYVMMTRGNQRQGDFISHGVVSLLLVTLLSGSLLASATSPADMASGNDTGRAMYTTVNDWARLPAGRKWGAASAIYPANDGKHIWIAERCGANSCVDSPVDPVLLFNTAGELVRSFGAGMISWPHGLYVDADDNVWVADAVGYNPVPAGWGHVIYKFSPTGELLMTLGKKGQPGDSNNTFRKPSDMLVAPDGSVFVVDGHGSAVGEAVNNRVMKFTAKGEFIMAWGSVGGDQGEFKDPHALAMDSAGRLFVGDRGNSRIQIFDQNGKHLSTWTQFGRPSGLFIDADDRLYSADSESNTRRNPGFKRGIRIGSVVDGFVTAFIPDPEMDQDGTGTSGAEGVAVDAAGNIYGAEVGPRAIKKYIRK
jgi:sugar lactone lactonase YvrE